MSTAHAAPIFSVKRKAANTRMRARFAIAFAVPAFIVALIAALMATPGTLLGSLAAVLAIAGILALLSASRHLVIVLTVRSVGWRRLADEVARTERDRDDRDG